MTDRELMQRLLPAMERACSYYDLYEECDLVRERLAQTVEGDGVCRHCDGSGCVACDARCLPEQPEQEPVAWMHPDGRIWTFGRGFDKSTFTIPLYTTPPHRKPLTDEEIDKLPWEPHEGNPMTFAEGLRYFARAIEAAHGIKE